MTRRKTPYNKGNCCTTMCNVGFEWYFGVVLEQFKLGQVLDVIILELKTGAQTGCKCVRKRRFYKRKNTCATCGVFGQGYGGCP